MDNAVASAVAMLNIDHAATVRLLTAYSCAAFHYRHASDEALRAAEVSEEVDLLRHVARAVKNGALILAPMPEHYREWVARKVKISAGLHAEVPITDLLLAISVAIDGLVGEIKPPRNRPPRIGLERAVRTLLPVIEEATGSEASIKWNKVLQIPPESGSSTMAALLMLLKQLDSGLNDTTIFNMVEKVRKRPEKRLPLSD